MEREKQMRCPQEGGLLAVRTLASRLARRAHLRRFCSDGHPVLAIEESLIEMAVSKLHEFILSSYERDDIPSLRRYVEAAVRVYAAEKAVSYDEDESVRQAIVEEACSFSLDRMLAPAIQ